MQCKQSLGKKGEFMVTGPEYQPFAVVELYVFATSRFTQTIPAPGDLLALSDSALITR
jgi:hypothetical protein